MLYQSAEVRSCLENATCSFYYLRLLPGADASSRVPASQLSLDTSELNASTYSSSTMERKKKKGLFSIFRKKEGKFKPVSRSLARSSTGTRCVLFFNRYVLSYSKL